MFVCGGKLQLPVYQPDPAGQRAPQPMSFAGRLTRTHILLSSTLQHTYIPNPPLTCCCCVSGTGQDVRVRLAGSYRLSISQTLLDSLSRHKLGIYNIAWLDGVLQPAAADAAADAADGDGAVAVEGEAVAGAEGDTQQQQQQKRRVHWADQDKMFTLVPPSAAAAAAAGGDEDATGHASSMDLDMTASVVSERALSISAAATAAGNGTAEGAQQEAATSSAAAAAAAAAAAERKVGDHGGIFIGDVQLSAVKAALATAGISASFQAGRLLVRGGLVVSREGGDGGLMVQGPLCEDYFKVRHTVYSLYNIC